MKAAGWMVCLFLMMVPGLSQAVTVPHQDMTVISVDSEELVAQNTPGTNAIDGNATTLWRTEYKEVCPTYPHEIIVCLGNSRYVCGFSYLPRQDQHYYGGVAAYEFYVSVDGQEWGVPVAAGTFRRTHDKQDVIFNVKKGRYVRLVALSEVDGHPCLSMAELSVEEQSEESIHFIAIAWGHPQSAPIVGFILRINNKVLVDISDNEAREWIGNVAMHPGVNVFEMLAYDAEGNRSEWSRAALYTFLPPILPPTGLTVEDALKVPLVEL